MPASRSVLPCVAGAGRLFPTSSRPALRAAESTGTEAIVQSALREQQRGNNPASSENPSPLYPVFCPSSEDLDKNGVKGLTNLCSQDTNLGATDQCYFRPDSLELSTVSGDLVDLRLGRRRRITKAVHLSQ